MPYSVGTVNAFSWATKRPGGFTAEEMGFFHHILPAYAAVAELKALRRFIGGILTTYVGDEAGKFILDGQVRRGDVREITAALMLVDLRDFSMLSDRLEPRAVIRILNRYFDCVMPPMRKHGGEVVEIMGDGVLAIFREEPGRNPAQACEAALMAATAGLDALRARNRRRPDTPTLSAGAALHYGTVSYGNIGTDDRLDFTVIGPDVNLTSRIERLCRELDRMLIMSEAFADMLGRPMPEIGQFELRGFARMQRLFGLPGRWAAFRDTGVLILRSARQARLERTHNRRWVPTSISSAAPMARTTRAPRAPTSIGGSPNTRPAISVGTPRYAAR